MKLIKVSPTCFDSSRNHHQGATTSAWPKLQVLFNCACRCRHCQRYDGICRQNADTEASDFNSFPWTLKRITFYLCVFFIQNLDYFHTFRNWLLILHNKNGSDGKEFLTKLFITWRLSKFNFQFKNRKLNANVCVHVVVCVFLERRLIVCFDSQKGQWLKKTVWKFGEQSGEKIFRGKEGGGGGEHNDGRTKFFWFCCPSFWI